MPKYFFWTLAFAAASCPGLAQNQCQSKPGSHTITIPLQSAPNSFEPACQPARIRVNDRAPVTLHLTGLSPIDVCAVSSKPPTVTSVASPFETIVNTVTGLKSFDFEAANNTTYSPNAANVVNGLFRANAAPPPPPKETPEQKKKREELAAQAAADAATLSLFIKLSQGVIPAATTVFAKQATWLKLYQTDVSSIALYIAHDYRTSNYTNFQPETDPQLATVRSHLSFPTAAFPPGASDPPSELDYAGLQALTDEMKTVQSRLLLSCTTAGKDCDPTALSMVNSQIDSANAFLLVANDNLKTLQADQAAVVTSYTALDKVYLDYQNRLSLHIIAINGNQLTQEFRLPPDYGATDTGTLACTSDALSTQATTDSINYSVLYQNVPALTVSTGLLVTFLAKREIGTQPQLISGTTSTYFAVTDSAAAQVFPMAFVNYRIGPPALKTWWGQPEDELVLTNNVSAGIGVNSNTGTNQPEFFVGDTVGFSRVYLHFGVHFGRTESLGGGFQLNTVVPTGFSGSAPIDWSYHPAFAIGLSVRIAPF